MKYTKTCDCCGHMSVAYPRRLNAPLIQALSRLVQYYFHYRGRVKLKELGLGNSQHANFNWLGYFGLAHKNSDGWVPTRTGVKFLNGEITIPSIVLVMNNEVLSEEHEAWDNFRDRLKYIYVLDLDESHEIEEYWKDFKNPNS